MTNIVNEEARSRSIFKMPTHIPIKGGRGSRGGAPIWVLHGEGFGLKPGSRIAAKRALEGRRWAPAGNGQDGREKNAAYEGPRGIPHVTDDQGKGDPDGYAVFGRFPKGMLRHVLKLKLLGDVKRDEVLHVCSGTLTERWTVDVRAQARPRVQADGKALPFRDQSFKAVLIDPPYSDAYARNLYGVENPRPSWLLEEAARVVVPGGRIGLLHVAIPFAPKRWARCRLVRVWPVSTGVGFRIRALTIYEREQEVLPFSQVEEFRL